jgi:hypothetical protein
MPRKSAAALAIAPPVQVDGRLAPWSGLKKAERELWREIVDSKPAEWFDVGSAPLLREYVRAVTETNRLARMVAGGSSRDPAGLKMLLEMRDREVKRMADLATKLRLTQQSRYTPQAAATANKKATGSRPWAA